MTSSGKSPRTDILDLTYAILLGIYSNTPSSHGESESEKAACTERETPAITGALASAGQPKVGDYSLEVRASSIPCYLVEFPCSWSRGVLAREAGDSPRDGGQSQTHHGDSTEIVAV